MIIEGIIRVCCKIRHTAIRGHAFALCLRVSIYGRYENRIKLACIQQINYYVMNLNALYG